MINIHARTKSLDKKLVIHRHHLDLLPVRTNGSLHIKKIENPKQMFGME